MVGVLKRKCLLERKQTLGAIASGERVHDRLRASVATVMGASTPAPQDRADEAQPVAPVMSARSGGVEDYLGQGLVHMLDVGGRVPNQTLALAHVGSQLRNLSFGPKAGSHQPKRMEPLQPLRIGDIGLPRASAPLLTQNTSANRSGRRRPRHPSSAMVGGVVLGPIRG